MGRIELWHFFGGLGLCLVVAVSIVAVIHRRFQVMMIDLCEGEARARFWTPAVESWFLLSSLTAALAWKPDGLEERQLFLGSICLVKSGLQGMSNSIILFSIGLIAFVVIRKFRGKETAELQKGAV